MSLALVLPHDWGSNVANIDTKTLHLFWSRAYWTHSFTWVTEGGDLGTADWGCLACVCRLHTVAMRQAALVSDENRIRGVRMLATMHYTNWRPLPLPLLCHWCTSPLLDNISPASSWSSLAFIPGNGAMQHMHRLHKLSTLTAWPKYCNFLLLNSARKQRVSCNYFSIELLVLCSV